MKKLISAILVLAPAVVAAAQATEKKWHPVSAPLSGSSYYVDPKTAVRTGDVVIYWTKSEGPNSRGQLLAIYTRQAVTCGNLAYAILDSYASLDNKPSASRTFREAATEDMFFLRELSPSSVSAVGAKFMCDNVRERTPL